MANSIRIITITYSPIAPSPSGGEDGASFVLTSDVGDNLTVELQGVGVQSGLSVSPDPMEFNFVQPGASLAKTLMIRNIGNQSVTLSSVSVTNAGVPQPAFSAIPMSGTLEPGEGLQVSVTFEPSLTGYCTGELDVASSDGSGLIGVALEGWGGGAAITCAPGALDFTSVGAGVTTFVPVICTNTGSDVITDGALDPMAELNFITLETSSAVFSAAFDVPAAAISLRANQSVRIDVGYDPLTTQQDTGTLTIVTNVTNPPAPPVVALSGSGVNEQKCYFSVLPSALNWGEVSPGVAFVDGFSIANVGPNECIVSGLSLTAGTDPAFSLVNGQLVSQRLSPVSGGPYPNSLAVPVRFEPAANGNYAGAVAFTITDPDAPHQLVDLSGIGGDSCLVINPNPLSFPRVGISDGQYCQNGKLDFTITNTCTQDATISSLAFASGAPPFQLIDVPAVPFVIPKTATSVPIQVGFKPTAAGVYYGALQLTSNVVEQPLMEFLTGTAQDGDSQTDQFTQHVPKVDILWVVDTDDDFGYFSGTGNNFFPELQSFIAAASGIDYHMAVTTVEICPQGDRGNLEPCSTCHNTSYNGSNNALILTPKMADPGAQLQDLLNNIDSDPCIPPQGDLCCGAGATDEHFLEAAQWAVDPTSGAATHNQGFIRPDAFLSLILVNGDAEDDYSPGTWQSYLEFFQDLKASPSLFDVNYIISDPQALVAAYPNLVAMVKQTGGVLVDTNFAQWATPMVALWQTVLISSTTFPLSGLADPTSISVFVDGPPPNQTANGQIPGVLVQSTNPNGTTNWMYDRVANTVVINPAEIQITDGLALYVEYTLICD